MSPSPKRRRLSRAWSTMAPWQRWLIALGLVAAVAIRLLGVGSESFWVDEVFSAGIVEGPFQQILDRIPKDKPPLDYYLQYVTHPVATPEISHRIPAVVASLFTVFGVLFWAWTWFGRRTALLAAGIAAFNFMIVYYAQEARPYSPMMALVAWQQGIFALWWRRRQSIAPATARDERLVVVLLFLLSLGALSTLYSALLLFASQLVFLVTTPLLRLRRPLSGRMDGYPPAAVSWPHARRATVVYAGVLALVLVPAALVLWNRSELSPPEDYFWKFEGFDVLRVSYILAHPLTLAVKLVPSVLVAALSVLLLCLGLGRARRISPPGFLQLLLGSVVPLLGLPFLYAAIDRLYVTRYSAFAVPGFCILVALAFETIARRIDARLRTIRTAPGTLERKIAFGLVLVYALGSVLIFEVNRPYRPGWREAAARIASDARPGDRVIVAGYLAKVCFEYYLERNKAGFLHVLTQTESEARLTTGSLAAGRVWMVSQCFGDEIPRSEFHGIDVHLLGEKPSDRPISKFVAQLGEPPTLWMADGPVDLLGKGWSLPEEWSPDMKIRWAISRHASVFLPLPEARTGRLSIAIYPHSYEGAPEQTIVAVVNGHRTDSREAPIFTTTVVDWTVPAEWVHPGLNEIDFEFSHIRSPSELKKNYGDFRTLAAAVQYIRWEVAPTK